MTRQEKFKALLTKHNYKSLNNFCDVNGLQQGNFNKRLKYEGMKVDLITLFQLANILHEPIETLIEIFYPEEWINNRAMMDENDLTIKRQ